MTKKIGFLAAVILMLSAVVLPIRKIQGHEEKTVLSYAKRIAQGQEIKQEQYNEIKDYIQSSEKSSRYDFLEGIIAYGQEDYHTSVREFTKASEKLREQDEDFIKIYTYVLLNESLQYEGETGDLKKNSQKALDYMASSKEYRNDMSLCWRIASIFLENQEDNGQGAELLEAYVTGTDGLTDESRVKLYGNIGQLYSTVEDYSAALQYCWRGIELLDASPRIPNHSKYMSKFWAVIGDNAYSMEQYEAAIEYYNQSLAIAEKGQAENLLADSSLTLVNKGTAYLKLEKEREVLDVLKELDGLIPELPAAQRDDVEILQRNLRAQLYIYEGDFEKAQQELEEAQQLLKTDDVEYSLNKDIYVEYSCAELYKGQGRFEEALRLYQQVLKRSLEAGLGLEKSVYFDMSDIYLQERNKEAYIETREKYAETIALKNQHLSADYIEYSEKVYGYYSLTKQNRIKRIITMVTGLICLVILAHALFWLTKWRKRSYTDYMSRLHNRAYLTEYMRRKKNQMTDKPLSLLMIDIDYFKQYNDYYGHVQGDAGIRILAEILTASVGRKNLVIRYGGEEMLVLLQDTTENDARNTAEQIRKNLAERNIPHEKSKVSRQLTVSMGICTVHYKGEDIFEIIEKADELLYEAKRQGRDCYVCG